MRITIPLLSATLLLGLAACDSSDNEGGRPPESDPLNTLVLDQCRRMPENEQAIAINGRSFDEPGQFGACL